MDKENWILCPVCGNKTRLKIRKDTELKNFPLFCPKCRQETLIHVKQFNITVIKEPDAQTQSRYPVASRHTDYRLFSFDSICADTHNKTVVIDLAAQNGGFEILYFKPPFSF